jgi:hypothetical protein
VIQQILVNPSAVVLGGDTRVVAVAVDPDGDPLTLRWEAAQGTFADPADAGTQWTAPAAAGTYTLRVTVSDAEFFDTDSVQVEVGDASVVVLSDPPGAFIEFDGNPTARATPARFAPVPPGPHDIRVTSAYFSYRRPSVEVELTHAREDTVRFGIPDVAVSAVNLGRSDVLEIGGIAFLRSGTGFVYAARTPGGTGLFNATLSPVPGPGNGQRLVESVRLDEPVTVTEDGRHVLCVLADGRALALAIRDPQADGIIDAVDDLRLLDLNSRFGLALAPNDRVAFTVLSSGEPASTPIFWGDFRDTVIVGLRIATTGFGRRPSWGPESDVVVYERDGLLLTVQVSEGSISPSDTLATTGFSTSPAWGRWGPGHVAFLGGPEAGALREVRLTVPGSDLQVTVHEEAGEPRFLAWSPVQPALVLSRNRGGRGEAIVLGNLPIP